MKYYCAWKANCNSGVVRFYQCEGCCFKCNEKCGQDLRCEDTKCYFRLTRKEYALFMIGGDGKGFLEERWRRKNRSIFQRLFNMT